MNYRQSLVYLDQIQNMGIKFGLDNVRTVLASFGNPQDAYPSIHVAGSNGKGSVCAMLSHILALHGRRVGLFTSPHLVHVRERIRIDNKPISKKDFSLHLSRLKTRIDGLLTENRLFTPPTFFEMLSCLAFLYFRTKKVDTAVLEVGMGGRFDATNVVQPLVSVVTTISEEHQEYLGDTIAQIAAEKAGIIKSGIPVVCGAEQKEAYEAVRKKAVEAGAGFDGAFLGKNRLSEWKSGSGYAFLYRTGRDQYSFTPSLAGIHQGRNASVAIAVCERLLALGMKLEKRKIIRALQTTRWPGRLEVISKKPLVLVDGAHNVEGAKALRAYIKEFVSPDPVLIFAVMRDKKAEDMARILFPCAKKVIITKFPYHKAASPEDLADKAAKFRRKILVEPDLNRAVAAALREATPAGVVLAAGSLFLAGELIKILPKSEAA